MNQSRQAFEADYFGDLPKTVKGRERSGDGYKYAEPQFAWGLWQKAWQASRKQMAEEAGAVCDALRDDAKEAQALAAFKEAGDDSDAAACGNFWSTVSAFNAVLKRAAATIRSLTTPPEAEQP